MVSQECVSNHRQLDGLWGETTIVPSQKKIEFPYSYKEPGNLKVFPCHDVIMITIFNNTGRTWRTKQNYYHMPLHRGEKQSHCTQWWIPLDIKYMRPRPNGRYSVFAIFIFLYERCSVLIQISLKFYSTSIVCSTTFQANINVCIQTPNYWSSVKRITKGR